MNNDVFSSEVSPMEMMSVSAISTYQLKLEFTVEAGDTIVLPLSAKLNTSLPFEVEWEANAGVQQVAGLYPTYTYATRGAKVVTIKSNLQSLFFYGTGNAASNNKLTRVLSWGNVAGLVEFSFSNCANLYSIPNDTDGGLAGLRFVKSGFSQCTSLTVIPEGLFRHAEQLGNVASLFNGCREITSIPEKLFWYSYNLGIVDSAFVDCVKITSIPEKLFWYNTEIRDLRGVFKGCTGLNENGIPANVFRYQTNVQYIESLFWGTSIRVAPRGLFKYCVMASRCNYIFAECPYLTSVNANVFEGLGNVKMMQYNFYRCSNLTSIPEGLFNHSPLVTDMSGNFQYCSKIAAIPATLFRNNLKVTKMHWEFTDCTALRGTTPTDADGKQLWERGNITEHYFTFTGCTGLSNYSSIPDDWKR